MSIRLNDRAAAVDWARSVITDRRTVFIDTETTGLGDDAEVIDIAVVSAGGSVLFNSLIKPERPVPIESSRIHGIYDSDLGSAPRWSEVASWLETMLIGTRVVVYNAAYDTGVVNAACRRYGQADLASAWECAMLRYAAFVGDPGRYGDYKWHRLEKAAAAFGIEPGGHRALEDAVACRNVVLAMAKA
jgi:DNA polymerase III epsilon subunit-like protein